MVDVTVPTYEAGVAITTIPGFVPEGLIVVKVVASEIDDVPVQGCWVVT